MTMTNFDTDAVEQTAVLDGGKMSKLLRWIIHSLEIFMWEEDYALTPTQYDDDPYLDILPEFRDDLDWMDDDTDEDIAASESAETDTDLEYSWQVQIEYRDGTFQEITSFNDYLADRPEELYFGLLEYFESEEDDFEEELD